MAKFCIPCINPNLEAGKLIDGASVWLNNITLALRHAGHEAEMVELNANYEGDYVIIQSEWFGMPNLRDYKNRGGKVICLLGHFISHVYPKIETVKELSDLMVTCWKGKLLEGFDVKFLPHAYSDLIDMGDRVYKGDIVWAGNSYPLRNEGWFEGLDVYQIKETHPKDLAGIYRGAKVALSLHGDFQKDVVSQEPSRIADKPGNMINERFWQTIGAGACVITDLSPQMLEFFSEDELIIGHTKEEYQELVKYYLGNPEEGCKKLEKAREKIRKYHTYRNRVETLLEYIKEI